MTVSRIAVLVISLMFCITGARCQNSGAGTQNNLQQLMHEAGVPEQDMALIQQFWAGWHTAYMSADSKWYEQNLSNSFLRINADGKVLNKEQMIQGITKRKQNTARKVSPSVDQGQEIIKYYGDTIVDAAHQNKVAIGKGTEFSGWFTNVLVRQNGRWRLAATFLGNDKPK